MVGSSENRLSKSNIGFNSRTECVIVYHDLGQIENAVTHEARGTNHNVPSLVTGPESQS